MEGPGRQQRVSLPIVQAVLLAALYAFLGALLVFLWLDERRVARGPTAPPPAHLLVVGGTDPQLFPLEASNLLGRAADVRIRLEDPLVSVYHARISYAGGQWLVEDLGSRNGTLVNELVLESPVALTPGDVLTVGGVSLRFGLGAPAEGAGSPAIV